MLTYIYTVLAVALKKVIATHLAGLEPATFQLTAECANRLRHKCLDTHWFVHITIFCFTQDEIYCICHILLTYVLMHMHYVFAHIDLYIYTWHVNKNVHCLS